VCSSDLAVGTRLNIPPVPVSLAYRQIWRIPMAKGQKKSNRETKKPKKDKAVSTAQTSIVPASGRLVPPKTAGRVSG